MNSTIVDVTWRQQQSCVRLCGYTIPIETRKEAEYANQWSSCHRMFAMNFEQAMYEECG